MSKIDNFYKDIKEVSSLLKQRDSYFYSYDDNDVFCSILKDINLKDSADNIFAIKQRICFLRDDVLLNALEEQSFEELQKSKKVVFDFISNMYQDKHKELIDTINSKKLLTPFYRYIIDRTHDIGISMSKLASAWSEHIAFINKDLLDRFGDDKAIYEYLNKNSLIDTDDGEISDRCYSVLIKKDSNYLPLSYFVVFSKEIKEIAEKIELTIDELPNYKDDVFKQDKEFSEYFTAIRQAMLTTSLDSLIGNYKKVDIKWMALKSPIQIGHPLEYYEDTYRKSVAIEWDIRLSTSNSLGDSVDEDINNLAELMQKQAPSDYQDIYTTMTKNLSNVQLHLGRPMIYYGTSFNGMFSAQVVPNDENVSKEYGKKIFAFSESILENARAKPFMQIDKEVFPSEFLEKSRKILFQNSEQWHQIYEISTVGHEYGHILWCDEDSESTMNKSGNFKNVEEFKATAGGLLSYFIKKDDLLEPLLIDTIKRAIKLLVYAKHEDIRPYYIESLLHLSVLFETKILDFNKDELTINLDEDLCKKVKMQYQEIYKDLVYNFYLPKVDPISFLDKYIVFPSSANSIHLPLDTKIKDFVLYYQDKHKKIGAKIDTTITRESYQ